MGKSKFAQKRDDVEKDIVMGLRSRGAYVMPLTRFDLLVGYRGVWYVMECKTGDKKLTKQQINDIIDIHNRAPYHVVRSVDEALTVVFGE